MTPTQAQIIDSKIAEWNAWYETLPTDLKTKLSIHDFKRLGDNFYRIFVLTAAAQADRAKETGICEDTLEMMDAVDRRRALKDKT
jgi:hypothetical protein